MLVMMPDVEDALRVWFAPALAGVGEPAAATYAGSTPGDLSGRSATFVMTGGTEVAINVYRVVVACDFRAAREADAVRLGRVGAGLLSQLGRDQTAGPIVVTKVIPLSLPFLNPDPRHPTLHRVTCNVEMVVKGALLP